MIDKFSVIEPKMLLIVSQENRVMVSLFFKNFSVSSNWDIFDPKLKQKKIFLLFYN